MDYQSLATPESCYVDFCLLPLGTGTVSVAEDIAEVQKVLKASGLKYTLHSAGTTVEGSWDEVMAAVGKAHAAVHKRGVVRIQSSMRVGSRTDKKQTAEEKRLTITLSASASGSSGRTVGEANARDASTQTDDWLLDGLFHQRGIEASPSPSPSSSLFVRSESSDSSDESDYEEYNVAQDVNTNMAQDIGDYDADSSDTDCFAGGDWNEENLVIAERLQRMQETMDANMTMIRDMSDQVRVRDEAREKALDEREGDLDRREEARDRHNSLIQAQINRRLNKLESRLRRANEIGQGTTTRTHQV
ncbi:hypothetical protein ACHAP8_001070 [Fusarium lateritium]